VRGETQKLGVQDQRAVAESLIADHYAFIWSNSSSCGTREGIEGAFQAGKRSACSGGEKLQPQQP